MTKINARFLNMRVAAEFHARLKTHAKMDRRTVTNYVETYITEHMDKCDREEARRERKT